jgi:cyclomaltodextrinase
MKIQTPDWVKHAVFYQIFPDRFARSEPGRRKLLKNAPWEPWEEKPTLQGYKGGDLWGVLDRLDYLQDLGINAIYFTPIFQSACNHRYHTHDYYRIDPLLGGNAAFKALLDAAHERNLKIVLDGVFNHASRGFFFFNDILENGPYSPWLDWFKIEDWPLSAYDGSKPANYFGWAGNRALPQFNHENPEVREYIFEIAEYWLEFGIDGWRLDVPFEIKVPGFWQEFRDRVKKINPDAYIVGEVWVDAREWLDGTQFDGVMNYRFTEPTLAFIAGDRIVRDYFPHSDYQPFPALDAPGYGDRIAQLLDLYPWDIQLIQLNLLDSHDTARLYTCAQDDRPTVELATLLLFTFPGAPSIYYGDEVGLPGADDPDCRRSFPPSEQWDRQVLEYHRRLIALRHRYPALRTGLYLPLEAQGMIYSFARQLNGEELVVAVNAGMEKAQLSLTGSRLQSRPSQCVFGTGAIAWDGDRATVSLDGRSGAVWAVS